MTGFDYDLPEDLIAQTPIADRADSRLLHLERESGRVHHRRFRDCIELLEQGDLLVLNDTRVTAMRLLGKRPTGGAVELLLLRELGDGTWEALAKPGRRLAVCATVQLGRGLTAEIVGELADGRKQVRLDGAADRSALEAIALAPLPPYIHEPLADRDRYQTVYCGPGGSAAAPTAGLHFTGEILDALRSKGVGISFVTLDVGLDTFRPISVQNPEDHPIHGERCGLPEETADAVAACRGRVVAVGTTAVRTLETMANGPRSVVAGSTTSRLFIRPGFAFQIVDGMFTNFHMPRTTMLLMLCALAGSEAVAGAYEEAIRNNYRFLSFGDSMLIL